MKGILRRPLALTSALFLLLLFFALRSGSPLSLPLGVLFLLATLILVGVRVWFIPASRPSLGRGVLLTASLLLAASLAFFSAYRVSAYGPARSVAAYDGATAEAEMTVTKVESATAYSTTLLCRLHTIDGTPAKLTGRLYLPYAANLSVGDRIALTADFSLPSPDGDSLSDCYDYSQGILFEAEGSEDSHRFLSHRDPFPESQLEGLRTAIRRQFYPYLSLEDTGLVSALLIGDRTYLSSDLSHAFRNLGISHTLAVSGLHLGILCGSLIWLLRRLRLPRRAELPILLPILLFYMALVGSPSVLRAGGMLVFTFFAYPMGRRRDSVTSLLATVGVICLISPESVLDIGLLLSFFATLGILLIALPLSEKIRPLPRLIRIPCSALAVTGGATLFTLPFSVWYFGEWAILSPIANLILVPIITLLLYLAPILLLFSPIPPLAHAPALLIRLLSALLGWIGEFVGESDLLLPLNLPVIGILAAISMGLVMLLCLFRKTRPLTLAVAVIFLTLAGGYCTLHAYTLLGNRSVTPITDSGNDCLLIRAGTRTMLVDHSEGGYTFWADVVTAHEDDPLLKVDTLLLTHYHYRQISAITRLLQDGQLKFLILPKPCEADFDTAKLLAERAIRAGCQVRWYSANENLIGYHDFEVEVEFLGREDHPLSTVTVRYGKQEFIYSADVTGDPSEDALQGTHQRPSSNKDDPRWGQALEFSDPA